jgi:anti-sigma factor RsiW
MNASGRDWERLNAYVDGELPPDEAATIAEAVARDPALARQVAALSALKAGVNDAAPPYPGRLQLRPGPPRRLRRRVAVLAVAALLLVLLGVGGWLAELHRAPPGIELAGELHREWVSARSQTPPGTAATTLQVGLEALRFAYVPDLTQVALEFDGVRRIEARGSRGLHVGYLGPKGCAVSLVVFERPGSREQPLTSLASGPLRAWSWTTGGASFFLLAPTMDPTRLASIAKVVQRLTRARLPLDNEAVLALDQGRSNAAPCLT